MLPRTGNEIEFTAPRGAFQCSDGGWVAVSGSAQSVAERFLLAIGGEAMANDPRFKMNADRIKNGDVQLIINTPSGKIPREDEIKMRSGARTLKIPIITTMRAAQASVRGIASLQKSNLQVKTLQEYHASLMGR